MPQEPTKVEKPKITIIAWGTKQGEAKLTKQIKSKLFGGDTGHAAMRLTFPADERGKELIQKYCINNDKTIIPFEKTANNNYQVYFSWWPSELKDSNFALKTFSQDKVEGRLGVHVPIPAEINRDWRQSRKSSGLLSSRMITLGPAMTVNYPEPSDEKSTQIISLLKNYEETWNLLNNYQDKLRYSERQLKRLNKLTDQAKNTKKIQTKIVKLNQEINKFKEQIAETEPLVSAITQNFEQQVGSPITAYLSMGRDPDFTIDLPVADSNAQTEGPKHVGLDLESMLTKMHEIATDNIGFQWLSKNCSGTSMAIINAGIKPSDRAWMAKSISSVSSKFKDQNSILFKMFTPQSVQNTAEKLKQNIEGHTNDVSNKSKPILIRNMYKFLLAIKKLFKIQQKTLEPSGVPRRPASVSFLEHTTHNIPKPTLDPPTPKPHHPKK